MKIIRWIIGITLILCVIAVIAFVDLPSMLGWQSRFLSRAFVWLVLSTILCLYRIVFGPTAPDRAVAMDMMGVLIVGFCALLSISTGRDWYLDIGIAWALQSFIGIMALSKCLEGKDLDE